MPKLQTRLSPQAEADFRDILDWSAEKFGEAAAARYEELVYRALLDIAEDPNRPGTQRRSELAPGVQLYHLSASRDRVSGGFVKRPRHFIAFRVTATQIEVERILHDSRDLARHVDAE